MLAILGLFGAVCAGVLTDSLMSGRSQDEGEFDPGGMKEDGNADYFADDGADNTNGDLLDWAGDDPETGDLPEDEDLGVLHVGEAGDIDPGGTGADTFEIGDWTGDGEFATIRDFNPVRDELVVVYDAQAHPDPQISLIPDDENGVTVLLDGFPLAQVADAVGLDIAQLRLVPSRAA
ncbi:MAG: hypothetical protein ACK5M4_14075 [Pseudorhodobacter sp.]